MSAPCMASGVGAREEAQRGPIVAELRRVYGLAILNMASLMLLLVPSALLLTYLSSRGMAEPLHLPDVVQWVRAERRTWKTEVLLGVPITVLFPSVLTVLLTSAPSLTSGGRRAPREEAFHEVLRSVLYYGLLLGAAFALLAGIPPNGRSDLPGCVLALAIAVGCVVLSGTLRIDGTQRDLLVAKAVERRRAALASQAPLFTHLDARAPWSEPLLRSGWAAHAKAVSLGVVIVGTPPAAGLGLWSLTGGLPKSGVAWVVGLVTLAAYLGGQGLFLVFLGSRRRLATTRQERLSSLGFLMVPATVLGLVILSLAVLPVTPGTRSILLASLVGLGVADVLAYLLGRSIFATIVDYRRLSTIMSNAESQIRYLTDGGTAAPTDRRLRSARSRESSARRLPRAQNRS